MDVVHVYLLLFAVLLICLVCFKFSELTKFICLNREFGVFFTPVHCVLNLITSWYEVSLRER